MRFMFQKKVQEYYDEWQDVTSRLQEVRVKEVGSSLEGKQDVGTVDALSLDAVSLSDDDEYSALLRQQDGFKWPRAACILDPLRATVTCDNPSDLLDAIDIMQASDTLEVVRIKNKYRTDVDEGVRNVLTNVIYRQRNGALICEVQVREQTLRRRIDTGRILIMLT